MAQVKCTITGLPDDVMFMVDFLKQLPQVKLLEWSGAYPNRNSEFVRRYVTLEVHKAGIVDTTEKPNVRS